MRKSKIWNDWYSKILASGFLAFSVFYGVAFFHSIFTFMAKMADILAILGISFFHIYHIGQKQNARKWKFPR